MSEKGTDLGSITTTPEEKQLQLTDTQIKSLEKVPGIDAQVLANELKKPENVEALKGVANKPMENYVKNINFSQPLAQPQKDVISAYFKLNPENHDVIIGNLAKPYVAFIESKFTGEERKNKKDSFLFLDDSSGEIKISDSWTLGSWGNKAPVTTETLSLIIGPQPEPKQQFNSFNTKDSPNGSWEDTKDWTDWKTKADAVMKKTNSQIISQQLEQTGNGTKTEPVKPKSTQENSKEAPKSNEAQAAENALANAPKDPNGKIDVNKALESFKNAFKDVPLLGKLFEVFFNLLSSKHPELVKEIEHLKLADEAKKDGGLDIKKGDEFLKYLNKEIKPADKESIEAKDLHKKQLDSSLAALDYVVKTNSGKNNEVQKTIFTEDGGKIKFGENVVIPNEFVDALCKVLNNSDKNEFEDFYANKKGDITKLAEYLNNKLPKQETGPKITEESKKLAKGITDGDKSLKSDLQNIFKEGLNDIDRKNVNWREVNEKIKNILATKGVSELSQSDFENMQRILGVKGDIDGKFGKKTVNAIFDDKPTKKGKRK